MKKCKYCNGTGRKKEKDKPKHSWYDWYSFREKPNEPCPKCYGKGTK